MTRMYTVARTALFGTPAGDLLRFVAGATEAVRIQSVVITGQTEVDDSNVVVMGWASGDSTGGTAVGGNPTSVKGAADSAVITFNPTVDATGITEHWREGMSILAGFQKIWTPGRGPVIDPTDTFIIKFTEVWTADPTISCTIEYDEIG